MYDTKRILGLIPARGGSKGVARKNIRDLAGKPLLAWTLAAANASRYLDRVLVSTDDREIAEVAQRYGGDCPFLRPAHLAGDGARSIDSVYHCLDWLAEHRDERPDLVVLLQPTSPLRTAADVDTAIDYFYSKEAGAVVSVYKEDRPPVHTNTLPADLALDQFLDPDHRNLPRQEFPDYYTLNGALFLATPVFLRRHHGWFGPGAFAYIMPRARSLEIDSPFDFELAQWLMSRA